MGSTLKLSLVVAILQIHLSDSLVWHQIDISMRGTCRMRKMDPIEEMYYILLWQSPETTSRHEKIDLYYENHTRYVNESCIYKNCLFTHSMNLINLKQYDAILFNGRNIKRMTKKNLPSRNPKQVYGFVQIESAQNFPLTNPIFDDFFNLTITYKRDSDIPQPYFTVQDINGTDLKPNRKPWWKVSTGELDIELDKKIYGKSKLAAWFVSRCDSISKREEYVENLNEELTNLGFTQTVEIFGECGIHKCPQTNQTSCLNMLSKNYMFYLAFEYSFSEDYITEKVLNALQHDTVPIVYGGADYNRFLPKGSFINACEFEPKKLAKLMVSMFENRRQYKRYFKWRSLYSFKRSETSFPGTLCEMLNDKNHKYKRYLKFRDWWNKKHIYKCNDELF